MSGIFKQKDYYNLSEIEARLANTLSSEEWENIKKTDIGQNLLRVGANIVHLDAMAFFTGLDQMFKSTVTMSGYLEEIAKSKGIIPKTYISANITLSLYSLASTRSFLPMDFSVQVGGNTFYNVGDVTIGQSSNPTTLVVYEGSVVREASEAGRPQGSSWTYSQFGAVQSERIGDRVVRKYIILPRETYVDSIIVESGVSWDVPFIRWQQVKTWYGVRPTDRAWKLGKDFLGRYVLEFGDGVYGREYPTEEIVGIRYLLSGGEGITVDSFDGLRLYGQDVNNLTNDFVVGGISNLVDGRSEVNLQDLHIEIEVQENTRESLITEDDHKNYLESRPDVLYAVIKAERHASPPNVEYFNTVTYAIKPNAEGGTFNDSDIQAFFAKAGLKTVEYKNIPVKIAKFDITVSYKVSAGYADSGVQSQITSLVGSDFDWGSLGFQETISEERVYALIKDISGLDVQSLEVRVSYTFTNETTGDTEFLFNAADVLPLRFYPRRFRMYLDSDVFVPGSSARDNGMGGLFGDVAGVEQFNLTSNNITKNSFSFGNLMLITDGLSDTASLIDLRKSDGAVSKIRFLDTVLFSCWGSRYNELMTVEQVEGTLRLRAYAFPQSFFDINGFNYIQLSDLYTYTSVKKERTITPPAGSSGLECITHFDGYVYVVWNMTTGNSRLYRYRVMAGGIEDVDTGYNVDGYVALTDKPVRAIVGIENAVGGSNALFISTDSTGKDESGLDVVLDFDSATSAVFESDFFRTSLSGYAFPFPWYGLTTDGTNLYAIIAPTEQASKTILIRLSVMNLDGTCTVRVLSTNNVDGFRGVVHSLYNSVSEVFAYSVTEFGVYKVRFDDLNVSPIKRAGNAQGDVTSITKIATINYDMQEVIFDYSLTGVLRYESENDLTFENEEMPILDTLSVIKK